MSHVNLVTVDTDGSSTDTLATAAFTTSGSNRHIDVIVGIADNSANAVTSMSRLSETYTLQREDSNPSGSNNAQGKWYMSTTEPGTGSGALTTVLTTAKGVWGFSAEICDGVNQTTRIRGGSVTLNPDGDSTVANLVLTTATASGDLVVSGIVVNSGTLPTAISGDGTLRGTWQSSTTGFGGVATAPGAASVTLGWNGTPFRFVHYAASHPAPSGTAPVLTVPGAQTATLGTTKSISGFSFTDSESNVDTITATCADGMTITFDLSSTSVTDGSTNGTASVSLSGSNAELSTVLGRGIDADRPEAHPTFQFDDTLTLTVIDDGDLEDEETVAITWTPPTSKYKVLTGTPSEIIDDLQGLDWTPPTDESGNFDFVIESETDAALTDNDQFTVAVTGVSPVLTVPGTKTAQYDVAKSISGVSVSHASGLTESLLFECPAAMTMTFSAGSTGATITGNESNSVLIEDDNETDLNTVAATLQVNRATPVSPIASDLVPNTANDYTIETNLQESDTVYTDRAYTFVSIPSSLLGMGWISTPNDDKGESASDTLAFDLNAPAWVYLTLDGRYDDAFSLPSWLATWEQAGITIVATNSPSNVEYLLYRKSFGAETVTLGGYDFGLLNSNYVVIIVPIAATIPIMVTATDSNGNTDEESFNVAWSATGVSGGFIPLLRRRRRR